MDKKPITRSEASKLNASIETLRNFCNSNSSCKGCPFRKEDSVIYGVCKFGSFYPELWDGLEIKDDVIKDT